MCLTADWVCVPVYFTADWVCVRIFLTFFLYVSQYVSNTGTAFVSLCLTNVLACVPTSLTQSNVFRYVFQCLAKTEIVVCVPVFPTFLRSSVSYFPGFQRFLLFCVSAFPAFPRSSVSYFPAFPIFPRSCVSYFPVFQRFLLSCVPAFPASPTHRDLGAGSFVSRLFQSVVELIEAIRTRQTGSFPANKRDDSQHECQVGNNRCSCHQLIRMLTATIPALQHRTCNFD